MLKHKCENWGRLKSNFVPILKNKEFSVIFRWNVVVFQELYFYPNFIEFQAWFVGHLAKTLVKKWQNWEELWVFHLFYTEKLKNLRSELQKSCTSLKSCMLELLWVIFFAKGCSNGQLSQSWLKIEKKSYKMMPSSCFGVENSVKNVSRKKTTTKVLMMEALLASLTRLKNRQSIKIRIFRIFRF